MDDEDIEYELARMEEAERRREEPPQPTRFVYRPVDPGLQARILRQMGQPYDPKAIDSRESFYLNGWDNGEDEEETWQAGPLVSRGGAKRPAEYDPWANVWKLDWGKEGSPAQAPRTKEYRPERDERGFPNLGMTENALGYRQGGNGTWTGVQPMSGGVNGSTTMLSDNASTPGGESRGDTTPSMLENGPRKTAGGNYSQGTPRNYNQDWYDENIWNSPEVLGAKTRSEREAAINRIVGSQAGEGLMRNYYNMHGNETDAEIAKNNDVKYIADRMEFNRQYGDYVARVKIKGGTPADPETMRQIFEKNGTIEPQYLGSGVKFDMADNTRKAAGLFRAMGYSEEATKLEKVAGEYEAQARENPNWKGDKWLFDRMQDAISLTKLWQKAKEIPTMKDPLGENKLGDTIRGRFGQ